MPPVFYERKRRWPLFLAAVLLAILIAAVAMTGRDEQSAPTEDEEARAHGDVPLQHVHGLGVDPLSGALYAATHAGLFRFSGHGDPEHVGGFQDLMGFTIIGPDHFLASGHPDVAGIRRGMPGHLGVMESTNGGADWTILALGGEADLHAMAHGDDQTYAVDAKTGRFLASSDLLSWESRSTSRAASIAIDPDDGRRLVAADGAELQITDDGGHTWRPLEGPPLLLVAWGPGTGLWGVTADGRAHVRRPADGTWRELPELPSEPEAVLSDGGTMYAAIHHADGTTILMSSGGSWQEHQPTR